MRRLGIVSGLVKFNPQVWREYTDGLVFRPFVLVTRRGLQKIVVFCGRGSEAFRLVSELRVGDKVHSSGYVALSDFDFAEGVTISGNSLVVEANDKNSFIRGEKVNRGFNRKSLGTWPKRAVGLYPTRIRRIRNMEKNDNIQVAGNLGADPIFKVGKAGEFAVFSLCVEDSSYTGSKFAVKRSWQKVVGYGNFANYLKANKVEKGDYLRVVGRVCERTYRTKEGAAKVNKELVVGFPDSSCELVRKQKEQSLELSDLQEEVVDIPFTAAKVVAEEKVAA